MTASASSASSAAVDALVDGEEESRDYAVSLLDVTEAIGAHFHEHHDAIMAWSWKLFCAKWARMLEQVSKREAERRAKDEERRQEELTRELMASNRMRLG